jgi:hypothetical protein
MRLLLGIALLATAYRYAGTPGLVILALAVVFYLLLRTRAFHTCPRCHGHGARTRILGDPITCRACGGTGFATRADRRKAPRMPRKNTGR